MRTSTASSSSRRLVPRGDPPHVQHLSALSSNSACSHPQFPLCRLDNRQSRAPSVQCSYRTRSDEMQGETTWVTHRRTQPQRRSRLWTKTWSSSSRTPTPSPEATPQGCPRRQQGGRHPLGAEFTPSAFVELGRSRIAERLHRTGTHSLTGWVPVRVAVSAELDGQSNRTGCQYRDRPEPPPSRAPAGRLLRIQLGKPRSPAVRISGLRHSCKSRSPMAGTACRTWPCCAASRAVRTGCLHAHGVPGGGRRWRRTARCHARCSGEGSGEGSRGSLGGGVRSHVEGRSPRDVLEPQIEEFAHGRTGLGELPRFGIGCELGRRLRAAVFVPLERFMDLDRMTVIGPGRRTPAAPDAGTCRAFGPAACPVVFGR
jgi:hypothetical protein